MVFRGEHGLADVCNADCAIHVDFLERATMLNSKMFITALKHLKQWLGIRKPVWK